jgi:tetratricopeptide (TPR) repeat protein
MQKRSKAAGQLEFEIGFYESLLRDNPEFTDAMVALGEAYTRRGWYDKGLSIDLQLTQLRERDPVVWYNLACSYSLLKRPTDALDALRTAVRLGYDDFQYLSQDTDLAPLRQTPEFRRFVEQLVTERSA